MCPSPVAVIVPVLVSEGLNWVAFIVAPAGIVIVPALLSESLVTLRL